MRARVTTAPHSAVSRGEPVGECLRDRHHPRCVVCAPVLPQGLQMCFAVEPDGSVTCTHVFSKAWEGYAGLVHGGILAAALDGAMTNWLLAHGHPAVTAELQVRYRHPVRTDVAVTFRARLVEVAGPIYLLQAEAHQEDRRAVTARAKFVDNAASARIVEGRP